MAHGCCYLICLILSIICAPKLSSCETSNSDNNESRGWDDNGWLIMIQIPVFVVIIHFLIRIMIRIFGLNMCTQGSPNDAPNNNQIEPNQLPIYTISQNNLLPDLTVATISNDNDNDDPPPPYSEVVGITIIQEK